MASNPQTNLVKDTKKKMKARAPPERKLLPKKRQPLAPTNHNSRKLSEVINLETEEEQPRKRVDRGLGGKGKDQERVAVYLPPITELFSLPTVPKKENESANPSNIIAKPIATLKPGDLPRISPDRLEHMHARMSGPYRYLPPPLLSPTTNILCHHGFTKYQSFPVGFGALNLARGEKPYAGDGYIDQLVGNDMQAFQKRHLARYWREAEEVEKDWPEERIWKQ